MRHATPTSGESCSTEKESEHIGSTHTVAVFSASNAARTERPRARPRQS
jgi:hypothetical protein